MPTPSTLALAALASLAFAAFPGPAVLYIVTRSIDQGRAAGLVSVAAIASGSFFHMVFAAVGLSRLLVASATAFTVVRWLGGAYLLALGIRRLLERPRQPVVEALVTPAPLLRIYRDGVVVAIFNPKTTIFYMAVLPQFVDLSRGAVWPQMLALGLVLEVVAVTSDSGYTLAASAMRDLLRRSSRFFRLERWVSGAVYLALGTSATLTGGHSRPEPIRH